MSLAKHILAAGEAAIPLFRQSLTGRVGVINSVVAGWGSGHFEPLPVVQMTILQRNRIMNDKRRFIGHVR